VQIGATNVHSSKNELLHNEVYREIQTLTSFEPRINQGTLTS